MSIEQPQMQISVIGRLSKQFFNCVNPVQLLFKTVLNLSMHHIIWTVLF